MGCVSRTWCKYVKNICQQYGIVNPAILMKQNPPSKSSFKKDIETRIISFHEKEQRNKAKNIKRMKYFNVSIIGLSNKCHPALLNINSSEDVKRSRFHIKMLLGDLYTYQTKSIQSGGDPHCILCLKRGEKSEESICHILICCQTYTEISSQKNMKTY